MRPPIRTVLCLSLLIVFPVLTRADKVDDYINDQMQKRHVPGLSLAIIDKGKIVKVKGYGVTDKESGKPVTPSTLFQAGSVSKSVSAVGVLRLVEQKRLSLDEDVNVKLKSWKVPENQFTKEKKVTLRGILSHTAGFTVHGFPGYEVGTSVPTLVQVLNGEKPANTPPIRVDVLPGSIWRYSGGGYTVMQQLVVDVTGKSFPQFMQERVLEPMGMSESTFAQPLPADKARLTAQGYYPGEKPVKGRWHVYPEMAAAGLWTTPTDLARFVIGIQEARAGKSNKVLSQAMVRQMLTDQKSNDGLGVFLQGSGNTLSFMHNGRDEGFDALMMGYVESGQGIVIMINANDNSPMVTNIAKFIVKEYHWAGGTEAAEYKPIPDKEPKVTALVKNILEEVAQGRMDATLYTPQLGSLIAQSMKGGMVEEYRRFGAIKSIALVERKNEGGNRTYRYRVTYKDESVLVFCSFNKDNNIAGLTLQRE